MDKTTTTQFALGQRVKVPGGMLGNIERMPVKLKTILVKLDNGMFRPFLPGELTLMPALMPPMPFHGPM